jgi:HEAT repeats
VRAQVALALLLCASLPARAQGPAPLELSSELDQQLVARIQAVLTPPATGPAPSLKAMTAELVALGDDAVPVVVALLAGEIEVPETAYDSLDPVHPVAVAARSEILRAALARLDQRTLVQHLELRAGGQAPLDWKLFALGLLAHVDQEDAPRVAVELAVSIEPIHLMRSYVLDAVETALAAQIERRPASLALLEHAAEEGGPELCCAFARSAARVRSAHSVEFLAGMLGRHAEADPVILAAIGQLAGDGGLAVDGEALGQLRSLLASEDMDTQRSAAVALGRLRDGESLAALCELLGSEDKRISSAAHWSLRALAGADLGNTPEPWLAWRDREQAWWNEQAPALLEALRSDQSGEVLEAISLLAQHPFLRHGVAEAMGPLLVHPDAGVALSACDAIAKLGSSHPLSWLVSALSSSDERVRAAAHAALRQMTGLELPADSAQWAKALQR